MKPTGRGTMRSYQTGRMQNFIIIGLVLLVMILGLNYFSLSRKFDDSLKDNRRQQEDIAKRMHEDKKKTIEKLREEHENLLSNKKSELDVVSKEIDSLRKELQEKKDSLDQEIAKSSQISKDLEEAKRAFDSKTCDNELKDDRIKILTAVQNIYGGDSIKKLQNSGLDIDSVISDLPPAPTQYFAISTEKAAMNPANPDIPNIGTDPVKSQIENTLAQEHSVPSVSILPEKSSNEQKDMSTFVSNPDSQKRSEQLNQGIGGNMEQYSNSYQSNVLQTDNALNSVANSQPIETANTNQELGLKSVETGNNNQDQNTVFQGVNNFQNNNQNVADANQGSNLFNINQNPNPANVNQDSNPANVNQNSNPTNEQIANSNFDRSIANQNNPTVNSNQPNQQNLNQMKYDLTNSQNDIKRNNDALVIEDNQQINPTPAKLNPEALIANNVNDQQQPQSDTNQIHTETKGDTSNKLIETDVLNSNPNTLGESNNNNMVDSSLNQNLPGDQANNNQFEIKNNDINLNSANDNSNLNSLNIHKRDLRNQMEETNQFLINTDAHGAVNSLERGSNFLSNTRNSEQIHSDSQRSNLFESAMENQNVEKNNNFDKSEIEINSKDIPVNQFMPKEGFNAQNSLDFMGEKNIENQQNFNSDIKFNPLDSKQNELFLQNGNDNVGGGHSEREGTSEQISDKRAITEVENPERPISQP